MIIDAPPRVWNELEGEGEQRPEDGIGHVEERHGEADQDALQRREHRQGSQNDDAGGVRPARTPPASNPARFHADLTLPTP